MNTKKLLDFIHEASTNTYASEDPKIRKKQPDNSTTITYSSGDWSYHDNYFGGEPYGGREVVFYKNKPVWIMVYYGWIEGNNKPEIIYPFLTEALRKAPKDMPYRGPKEHKSGDLVYQNTVDGTVENFIGEEFILNNDLVIFQTSYCGGLVNQK